MADSIQDTTAVAVRNRSLGWAGQSFGLIGSSMAVVYLIITCRSQLLSSSARGVEWVGGILGRGDR